VITSNTKYCKYCDSDLPISEFRIRFDKRRLPPLEYVNSKCKQCESKDSSHKWKLLKNGYIQTKRIKCEDLNNEPKRNKKWSISKTHKKSVDKYYVNNSLKLTDLHIAKRLKAKFPFMKRSEILKDKELIETKRAEILIYRLNKNI
jgi:hypothetical protein